MTSTTIETNKQPLTNNNLENNRTIRREKINAFIRYTILIVVGIMMLYPLLWMFTAAMKPNHEIFSSMSLIPNEWSLEGFINGWKTGTEFTFGHYILNTFYYVLPKVFFTVVSSTIVHYRSLCFCSIRYSMEKVLVRHINCDCTTSSICIVNTSIPNVPRNGLIG